jgi:peroxiredoxin Q/BCP
MAQLRQGAERLKALDIEVLIVGPENAGSFRKFWKKKSMPFVGLPDPDHSVMKLYGQKVKLLKLGRMPAQVLIDKAGIIRFAHYGNSMADIPSLEELENVFRDR